jgi:hypothetical protein
MVSQMKGMIIRCLILHPKFLSKTTHQEDYLVREYHLQIDCKILHFHVLQSQQYFAHDQYIGKAEETQHVPGTMFKLQTVFYRNFTNQYLRNFTNVLARLASYTMLSIIVSFIFWQSGKPKSTSGLTFEEAEKGILRASVFLVLVTYLLPFSSLPVFVGDKRFLAAESALALYPVWMYALSQVSNVHRHFTTRNNMKLRICTHPSQYLTQSIE